MKKFNLLFLTFFLLCTLFALPLMLANPSREERIFQDLIRREMNRLEGDDLQCYYDGCLYEAVKYGWFCTAHHLIESGAHVNSIHFTTSTPLHIAVQNSDVRMVDLLLKSGADTNVQDVTRWTPLHIAAHAGDGEDAEERFLPIAHMLLRKGARLDLKNLGDQTPAQLALFKGRCNLSRLIESYSMPVGFVGSLLKAVFG